MSDIIVRTFSDHQYQDQVYTIPQHSTTASRKILFMTGNLNKYNELLQCYDNKTEIFEMKKFDMPEIQHIDPLQIVSDKCKFAYSRLVGENQDNSIMVEDVSLSFNAFCGLPGPYIKWFVDAMKLEDIPRMLSDFEDKTAIAQCVYAIMDSPNRIVFCRGRVTGNIVTPRGSNGFGWDGIFEDAKLGLTYAEMDSDTKRTMSHRAKAIDALKAYLNP